MNYGRLTKKELIDELVRLAEQVDQLGQIKSELQQSRQREKRISEMIIESLPGIFYLFDDRGRYLKWNKNLEMATGYSASEISNMSSQDFFAGEDEFLIQKSVQKVFSEGADAFEAALVSKDGTKTPHVFSGRLVTLDGKPCLIGLGIDITEQKKTEERLRENEHLLTSILATAPVGIGLMEDRRMKWVNEAWVRLFGFDSEREFIGQGNEILYPSEEENERVGKKLYTDLSDGKVTETDATCKRKDGALFHAHVRLNTLYPADPNKGTVAAITDISDRKQVEEALRASEERYRMIFAHSPLGIIHFDENGVILDCNDTLPEMIGSPREKLIGFNMPARQTDERMRQAVLDALEGKISHYDGDYVSVFSGQRTPIRAAYGRILSDDGKFVGAVGILEDVTERRRAEESLRESEEKYRIVVQKAQEGINITQDGMFRFVNPSAAALLGFDEDEMLNRPFTEFFHPDDKAMLLRQYNRRLQGEKFPSRYEVRMLAKGGAVKWLEVDAALITWKNKPAVLVFMTDVTNRRKGEDVQRRLATAVEQAGEAIVIADGQGTIQYVNPAFERITGFAREEAVGRKPSLLKSGQHDEAFYRNLWGTITEGEPWSGRFINRKKNGTLYSEDATISPVRDSSGKIVSYVAVKRDVTKEIELRNQLLQAQKMEAIGTLAGGVAHDFNNLLTIVLGYSELLLDDTEESDPAYADIQKIAEASRRGAQLVRNLLAFGRRADIRPRPMNLNHEVSRVAELLNRTISKMIKIEMHLDGDLDSINADPDQMGQVLMNLTVNAEHAMPGGGKLTIATANTSLTGEYRLTHLEIPAGDCVLLTVSDTGHGMDRHTIEHIFEPFFTTKGAGNGSGLGLSMVYGIIQQHGGHIVCESEPGHGTTFKIYLPAITEEAQMEKQMEKTMLSGGTEKILLVDDEAFVRDLGQKCLTRAGYSVLPAGGGPEALEIYAKEGDQIALVILDLFMPEMGGDQCLDEILAINPRAKVIISSGASIDRKKKETLESEAKGFVSKPFRLSEMLKTVREVLDSD
jgi:two-component system, cell cycle sensor histidine kinase and response regulator CckA